MQFRTRSGYVNNFNSTKKEAKHLVHHRKSQYILQFLGRNIYQNLQRSICLFPGKNEYLLQLQILIKTSHLWNRPLFQGLTFAFRIWNKSLWSFWFWLLALLPWDNTPVPRVNKVIAKDPGLYRVMFFQDALVPWLAIVLLLILATIALLVSTFWLCNYH